MASLDYHCTDLRKKISKCLLVLLYNRLPITMKNEMTPVKIILKNLQILKLIQYKLYLNLNFHCFVWLACMCFLIWSYEIGLHIRFVDAFYSSYILDGKLEYLDLLHEWLDDETADWRLCYRASRDGWKSGDFHSRCDHKGPTVTLIQVGYNIFGGYSDIAWGGLKTIFIYIYIYNLLVKTYSYIPLQMLQSDWLYATHYQFVNG